MFSCRKMWQVFWLLMFLIRPLHGFHSLVLRFPLEKCCSKAELSDKAQVFLKNLIRFLIINIPLYRKNLPFSPRYHIAFCTRVLISLFFCFEGLGRHGEHAWTGGVEINLFFYLPKFCYISSLNMLIQSYMVLCWSLRVTGAVDLFLG